MHTCGLVVRTSKHVCVNSDLVGSLIYEKVRKDPLIQPIKVVGKIKDDTSLI